MNPEKSMFFGFLGIVLGYIVSNDRKMLDAKKVEVVVAMPTPKNPHDIQVFNGIAQFYRCFIKNFVFIMAPITKLVCKRGVSMDIIMPSCI